MISFKGAQFPKDIIIFAVFFYVRYTVSCRDLEEIMAETGVIVDHAALNRWVAKYAPLIASNARRRKAVTNFLARALEVNGLARMIVIDKSGANTAGITTINRMLKRPGCPISIEMERIKYLDNIVEQDHRTIKKRTRPMPGCKSFGSASATLEGIEGADMDV